MLYCLIPFSVLVNSTLFSIYLVKLVVYLICINDWKYCMFDCSVLECLNENNNTHQQISYIWKFASWGLEWKEES